MKLNTRSIQVLKNFATINPSIQFREGNALKTISPNKTNMARANLEDNIPQDFAIYDLSRFLGVVSLFEQPEFNLQERSLNISSTGRNVSYTFADPNTIVAPPNKDIEIGDCDISFEIKQDQFTEVMKALGVMGFPEIVVTGVDGKIILRATDTKNPSADNYDIELGETDREFTAVFKSENLKILQGDYRVSISSRGISHFASDDVEYWVSIESNSTFN